MAKCLVEISVPKSREAGPALVGILAWVSFEITIENGAAHFLSNQVPPVFVFDPPCVEQSQKYVRGSRLPEELSVDAKQFDLPRWSQTQQLNFEPPPLA